MEESVTSDSRTFWPHRPLSTAYETVLRRQNPRYYIVGLTWVEPWANYLVAIMEQTAHKGGQKTLVEQLHMSPVQGELVAVDHMSGGGEGRGRVDV